MYICEAINIYTEAINEFFLYFLSDFPLQSLNIPISYIPASILYVILNAASAKKLQPENERSFASRGETIGGVEASFHFSRARLAQANERTPIVRVQRNDHLDREHFPSRETRDERVLLISSSAREETRRTDKKRRAGARARLFYRSETACCHPLETHLQPNAALRCDNGIECSRDRRRRHSHSP